MSRTSHTIAAASLIMTVITEVPQPTPPAAGNPPLAYLGTANISRHRIHVRPMSDEVVVIGRAADQRSERRHASPGAVFDKAQDSRRTP